VNPGYSLSGQAELPESHVEYFRKHGRIRAKQLVPSQAPFAAIDVFAHSPGWPYTQPKSFASEERGRQLLSEQALRMLDSVFRTEPGQYDELLPSLSGKDAERARRIVAEASELKIRWDEKSQQYTFLDGTTLPVRADRFYRREVWRPKFPGLDLKLVIERENARYVGLGFSEEYEGGKPRPKATLRVFRTKSPEQSLTKFQGGGMASVGVEIQDSRGSSGYSSTGTTVKLAKGEEIQAELKVGEKTELSPQFRP